MKPNPFETRIVRSCLVLLATLSAFARSWAAFDLGGDFSPTNNPNGVWQYGNEATMGGTFALSPYRSLSPDENGIMVPGWQFSAYQTPAVYQNPSTTNVSISSGHGILPGRSIWFYPGENGLAQGYGVIRFTAPSNSNYRVAGAAVPVYDDALQGDTDFHLLKNGIEFHTAALAAGQSSSFSNVIALAASDTLDFVIGRGADQSQYASGLRIAATIDPTSDDVTILVTNPPPVMPEDFSVGRDFGLATNPSGVWSYGWKQTLDGSFGQLSSRITPACDNGVRVTGWILSAYGQPAVYCNTSTSTGVIGGGQAILPSGTVWLHPGANGRPENFSVVRFTAPSNATYQIGAAVSPLYSGSLAGNTDFHVVKNGTELFGQFLSAQGTTSFSNAVALDVGDTIDFAVGRGADANEYGSSLRLAAMISLTTNNPTVITNPPPPPPAGPDFNLSRDFGVTNNPFGAWSYGWKETLASSFSLVTSRITPSCDNGVPVTGWILPIQGQPAVYCNTAASIGVIGSGQAVLPPGTVWLHPGVNDRPENYSVVRFTVPSNSNYQVDASVSPLYSGSLAGDTDFHITLNGMELYGQFLGAHDETIYTNVVTANAGDTIDFLVGRGGDGNEYGSSLRLAALIAATTNAATAVTNMPAPPAPEVVHSDFDLARDFGATRNPAGVWSYGSKGSLAGAFNLVTARITPACDNGVRVTGWVQTGNGQPAIYCNTSSNIGSIGSGQAILAPRTVWYVAGLDGRPENYGVIRFTAPSNSNYEIDAAVSPLYSGTLAGDADFHVVKNSVELFGQFLGAHDGTSFTSVVELSAGETIDFAIGRGSDGNEYGSSLRIAALITPTTNAAVVITNPPPPPPPVAHEDFNLTRDFGADANPSGAWAYGWKGSPYGAFTHVTWRITPRCDNGVPVVGWVLSSFGQPAIYCNTSSNTGTIGGGQAVLPPGTVWLHPGINGRPEAYSAIRFTAPSNGNYAVGADATPLYSGGLSGDTDFHVALNTTEVFGRFLGSHDSTSFSNVFTLNSGDTIDFTVGRGSDHNEYGSSLRLSAVVTPTTNAATVVTNPSPPVLTGPVIVTQPSPQSASVGGTVTLSVTAQGDGPLTYQWQFNGVAVAGATNSTLEISDVQPANAGNYRVIVSNVAGSVTSVTATVFVDEGEHGGTLNFANSNTNRVYDVGGTNFVPARGSLAVGLFAGASPGSLQQIGGAVSFVFPGRFSGGIRSISSVAAGQVAYVQVRVWDTDYGPAYEQALAAGGKTGASIVFTAVTGGGLQPSGSLEAMPSFALSLPAAPAPQITSQPASVTVPLNQSASFSVGATGGGLGYQWFHNGIPKAGAVSATFNLARAQKSDAGDYFAVVSNNGGSVTCQVATLSVTVERTLAVVSPPDASEGELVSIPIVLEGDGVVGGMTFVLHYNADLLSAPEVVWDASVSNGLQAVSVPVLGQLGAIFVLNGMAVSAGTQTLAVVNFRARTVATNSTSELLLDVIDVATSSGDPLPYGTDVRNGTAKVLAGPALAGDNNGNGVLDVGDATLLIRLLAQLDSPRPWDAERNDLNQNQAADAGDAIRILLAAADVNAPAGDAKSRPKDAAVGSNGELALLAPSVSRGANGLVTYQVRLQNVRGSISGAALTLSYPPTALRIPDPQAQVAGALVPNGSAVIWNVSPTNNYAQQNGLVRFVASSATAWPSSTGVLAQVTFQIQPGATNQYAWPLALSRVEVSALGYNRSLAGGSAIFVGRDPRAGHLGGHQRLPDGRFQFNVDGDAQATFAIDASSDLLHWTTVTNVVNATGTLRFSDPDAAGLSQRFYRARVIDPLQ